MQSYNKIKLLFFTVIYIFQMQCILIIMTNKKQQQTFINDTDVCYSALISRQAKMVEIYLSICQHIMILCGNEFIIKLTNLVCLA